MNMDTEMDCSICCEAKVSPTRWPGCRARSAADAPFRLGAWRLRLPTLQDDALRAGTCDILMGTQSLEIDETVHRQQEDLSAEVYDARAQGLRHRRRNHGKLSAGAPLWRRGVAVLHGEARTRQRAAAQRLPLRAEISYDDRKRHQ